MNLFQSIRTKRPRLNKFDLSHERKFAFNMGDLIPILVNDVVPGDKFRITSEMLIRFAPMLAPMMHRVNATIHFFFVPNRLVWDEWETFITGGPDGSSNPVSPYMELNDGLKSNYTIGKLADFMGVPVVDDTQPVVTPLNISVLPFRGYQLIYNEYYRDQNLETPIDVQKSSGLVVGAQNNVMCTMRKRAWEKDYFTSALPWAQRGNPVNIPSDIDYSYPAKGVDNLGAPAGAGAVSVGAGGVLGTPATPNIGIENLDGINITVNDLRRSIRLQEWLEKNARGGARYIEQILSHFGVKSSDARLQRPEYLGGGKAPVVVSEVLSNFQFSGDPSGLPQGNMAGHGLSVGNASGFKRTFEEHGYVIGLMSVLPRTAYQQGLPRHLSRFDKFDYFWPEFANIGEQEIKLKELWYDQSSAVAGEQDETFGYQSRYSEYKYQPSTVHGDFKENLNYWHMGRIFAAKPVLNASFVQSDPTSRIFAVTDPTEEKMYCQLYNRVDALRPMPYYGTPTL